MPQSAQTRGLCDMSDRKVGGLIPQEDKTQCRSNYFRRAVRLRRLYEYHEASEAA